MKTPSLARQTAGRLRFGGAARLFAGQAFWSAAGALMSSATNVLLLFAVTRMMGVEPGGAFVLFQTTIVAVSSIVGWGLAIAQTRGVAICDHDRDAEYRLLQAGELLASLASLLAFGIVAACTFTPNSVLPTAGSPIVLGSAAASVFGAVFDGLYKAHLTGQGRMRCVAVISLCGAAAALGALALLHPYGVGGATAAVAIGWLVQAALGATLSHFGQVRSRPRLDLRLVTGLVQVAIPATVAGVMVAPSHWLVQTLLVATPGGYAKVALLGLCLQWFNAVTLVPTSVGKVAMPLVARRLQKSDSKGARQFLTYSLMVNGGLTIPLAVITTAISPWLLGFYSPELVGHTLEVGLAMTAATITAFQVPFANVIWARSRAWFAAGINAIWAAVFVGGAVLFMAWATSGVLLALGIAYVVTLSVLAVSMRASSTVADGLPPAN